MATRWQRHRPSQRWLLRRWLRWLCCGGCGSWWLRWWLRRGWLRRWLRWWPRLADAPPPRQGRHLVVTTGCKWSGSERLSVAVGKRGGEGSRHSPPARGEVYWHGSGRRPAPAVPVHGHRGTGGAAVHHGAGLRPAPAVPVQASGLLLHAGARCAPAPCVLWNPPPTTPTHHSSPATHTHTARRVDVSTTVAHAAQSSRSFTTVVTTRRSLASGQHTQLPPSGP